VAIPIGGPITVALVGSPDYFKRYSVPRHPSDLVNQNCIRFRFSGSGAIYKWEFDVDAAVSSMKLAAASRSATPCMPSMQRARESDSRTRLNSSHCLTFVRSN